MKISYYLAKAIKYLHIPAIKNSTIHPSSKVLPSTHMVNTLMGKYSFIGTNCTVIDTTIGNFCSIADNVIIGGSAHPIEWVSSSPVFHQGKNIMHKNFSSHPFQVTKNTILENDIWIGNNCLIKSGVTIGNGAIIGMGSVVTKDVPPYEIWAGNPAKFIRTRFEDHIINELLKIKWWEWDDDKLEINAKFMNSPAKFVANNSH